MLPPKPFDPLSDPLQVENLCNEALHALRTCGSHVICEKYRKNANGTFTCYVCVELASEDVLAALNSSISDDSKLRIDYDYEKFKKIFEEEMSKAQ